MAEIRNLKNKDVWTIAGILAKVARNSKQEIRTLIKDLEETDEDKKAKNREKGVDVATFVLNAAFQHASSDLQKWLADLSDMSKDEFLDQDFGFTLDVIEELKKQDDVQDFFLRVWDMFKKLNK